MDPLPIVLPTLHAPARRAPLPFLAATMPVVGGVVLWLITGSLFSLCFAALGPLMMVASFADTARGRRRERRVIDADAERAWDAAERELTRLHQEERTRLWSRQPDAATGVVQPPLRGATALDADALLVVGSGVAVSAIRTTGGDGDRARAFQERARRLLAAPVSVRLGGGVCVRGPEPLTAAVTRALIVQLCLRFSPSQVTLVGERLAERGLAALPHASSARRGFRLGVASAHDHPRHADALIWTTGADEEIPEGITTVIDVLEPRNATLRTPDGVLEIAVECLSLDQFAAIALERAESEDAAETLPESIALHELAQTRSSSGLPATIGRGENGDIVVDIVEDGPHAIVTGTTGTGKSELLVSWVTAIASVHGPDRVNFVLADFKGGTAFDPLRDLRQVVEVITDLDEQGARRGVSSLTAELRRREGVLAGAGVRDIRDSEIPRLVIVVDEFAALVQEHSDLAAVFTDIAARGRALGMHLILGTQRASGVVRDALAANCPLRMSLRVGDPADSRAVIGTTAASEIPGGASARGLCLVRRPQDQAPLAARIALTRAADVRDVAVRWAQEGVPQSPWMPALPAMLPLPEVATESSGTRGTLVWGRADAPDAQAQPLLTLAAGGERGVAIIGAAGSGRTSALRALRAQCADALWIPSDPERMWDTVSALSEGRMPPPTLVLCDDLDAQVAELPAEYAQHAMQRWEQLVRGATGTTFVVTAMRSSGTVGRLLDVLPRRALLRAASRVEHVAAGGESSSYDDRRPPGRAMIDGREAQIAWTPDDRAAETLPPVAAEWMPTARLTGVVTAGAASVVSALRAAHPHAAIWSLGDADAAARMAPLRSPGATPMTVPQIVVGEAESWQREWALWQRVRAEGEVLVRAERAADLRQLVGFRELPPLARLHAGRVWALVGAEQPRRLVISALAPGAEHGPIVQLQHARQGVAAPEAATQQGDESRRSRRQRGAA